MRTFEITAAGRRLKSSACGVLLAALLAAFPGALTASGAALAGPQFQSPDDALRQGVTAYRSGFYEIAVPALRFAAERNRFLGQFYLARIFADNDSAYTDHAKAYLLYQQIARDFADVDPEDPRSAFVADALVQLAGYMRRGLPEAGLRANRKRAAEYLNHAALYFNDENAQFELAKLMLREADGRRDSRARQGLDWLSVIARRGHAGAQAFLADLLWRGKFTEANPVRALALIAVAAKNAPEKDAFWIDDIFQNIFCGASEGVRRQATGLVADWDSRYGRKPLPPGASKLGGLSVRPVRTCADGETVPRLKPINGDASGFNFKGWTNDGRVDLDNKTHDGVGIQADRKYKPDAPVTFMRGGAASGLRNINERGR